MPIGQQMVRDGPTQEESVVWREVAGGGAEVRAQQDGHDAADGDGGVRADDVVSERGVAADGTVDELGRHEPGDQEVGKSENSTSAIEAKRAAGAT